MHINQNNVMSRRNFGILKVRNDFTNDYDRLAIQINSYYEWLFEHFDFKSNRLLKVGLVCPKKAKWYDF